MNHLPQQNNDANHFNNILAFVNKTEKINPTFQHSIKIRFLRNFTIEPIEPFLKFHIYQSGIKPIISYADYDTIEQELLDENSLLLKESPDILVLSLFYHPHDLFNHTHLLDLEEAKLKLRNLFDLALTKSNALILINTFIAPSYAPLTTLNTEISGAPAHYTTLNYFIRDYVIRHPTKFILMDWEQYFRLIGEENCLDYRYWYLNRAPFKKAFLNQYAQNITRVAKTLKGKIKKCLILDCDNTLWGGIIGEAGLEGIKLDAHESPGKIFYDFQQSILSLYNRGILITLCSKNNEDEVWSVLKNHPASLLKKEHLAAYRINWQDKASNIMSLAEELNLGLDSFIFVDDSKAECELIRQFLPEVTVINVPDNLFLLPQILFKENSFDALHINEDDKNRTLTYQQENKRKALARQIIDIEEYLKSLELKLYINDAKETELARIAQLTQKTNQFNLSTRRYTETDIKNFANTNKKRVFSLWAQDRFGNYGLTGTLIAENLKDTIKIDSFLLSCRILSRRIEYAFISHCLQQLSTEWNIHRYHAHFLPTPKNIQVKNFLDTLGFIKINEQDQFQIYELQAPPTILPNTQFISINAGDYNEHTT